MSNRPLLIFRIRRDTRCLRGCGEGQFLHQRGNTKEVVNMAIVDSIMNLLTRQTTSSLADRLGATPSAVQAGIGTSVAALLTGIANRSGDPGFMTQVFNLV